jgi:hypothetical protein
LVTAKNRQQRATPPQHRQAGIEAALEALGQTDLDGRN